ncbi:8-oxo-dGTP diphosphatase MutT [Aliidiomarina sanyensis]|uniref:8-oxo-dGTP diphosphatase n=1 Tax=Aliidiomarina sanyensis TaxID=1249555 RepID=A0A432WI96_9GAMM|nr:8-oxo-dGTP diphosphatase MutT [Aliidiomarina sanyensis]RUO33493.1 8-oxo-dGTP diphosphatase MutT [Aliidiomarina sanyensis]
MSKKLIHVAVGVIENSNGHILISQRAEHLHQGGFWEFPGGKVEPSESVLVALDRELQEELNLRVHEATPLLQVPYDYPDKSVLLDVWHVTGFSGEIRSNEGQPWRWVARPDLINYAFPPANSPILNAVLAL